ncbi:exopolysaccharide biosynthesis polyprenyl glycosylphosphotransferase [Pedobacter punctiformis]|uniref:Exopolysaccharide biosynthesis polyprenyl glycosylphosphotransferase n=1 Tax=Pedobacter punctiformis TaxID=3004097 RepID=A0ABT4L8A6_9SPHI|nr:exopolysaccharide biosynthesis polyprenyl glycosylphosphotransferase [Pedobacter sp. HCMS5-2]MCZ4244153.1 exopolysaccharide biosynthesis polyprenyl glycosylphosphotransferase [Pedobacter sp. HCMS5-2]
MESRHIFILIILLIVLDALALNSSFGLIYASGILDDHYSRGEITLFLIFLNLTWLISSLINRTYNEANVQSIKALFKKMSITFLIQVLLLMVGLSFIKHIQFFNAHTFYILLAQIIGTSTVRLVIYYSERLYPKLNLYKKKIVIIGNHDLASLLERYFLKNKLSFNLAGSFTDFNTEVVDERNSKKINKLKDTVKFAIENNLDEVYTTQFPEQCQDLQGVLNLAEKNCVRVKYVTSFIRYKREEEAFANSSYIFNNFYDGIPILVNRREPLSFIGNRIAKRLFDIVFSLFVIVFLLSWFLPLMALLIKLESKGDALFLQLRSGKKNKPFYCYKFRSMNMNKDSNNLQASRNDPRITKIGAFMRKTSIDELPQFFNVLFGNMSVVGPRPHMLKHTEEYSKLIDQYMVRHFLKPGITGWAQINGFRGETKHHEQMLGRVKHDIWYMENWSLFLDIKIIYKTVVNAIKGEENAF